MEHLENLDAFLRLIHSNRARSLHAAFERSAVTSQSRWKKSGTVPTIIDYVAQKEFRVEAEFCVRG